MDLSLRSNLNLRYFQIVILIFLGLIYGMLSFYQIHLPGLHYDEAFEAVPALQIWQGQPVTAFRSSGLTVGGTLFPLMTQDYIGAINCYTALPFIALFGPTPFALRTMTILTGIITLGLTYALSNYLSNNQWVGLAAVAWLAVDPTFIFWNRQGVFVTAITAPIGLGATLCWLKWYQEESPSRRWLFGGAFLLGLGLYAKLLFLWLIAALIGAILLLNLSEIKRNFPSYLRHPNLSLIMPTFLFFLAGCWPLLLYNLQTGGTWLNISSNAQTSYYGVNNYDLATNLYERFQQLITLLNGSHLWYLGGIFTNPLPFWSSILLLSGTIFFTTRIFSKLHHLPLKTKNVLLPFLIIGLVILSSIQTVSALWITHFAILMPWPAIALAVGGWFLIQQLPAIRGAIWLLFLLCLGTNLNSTLQYHHTLSETGGLSTHSDAIYDMSHWLATHAAADQPVVAMDWGLSAPITYLTQGQVTPLEIFGYRWTTDEVLTQRLENFIAQPNILYLWRAPDEIIFDRSAEFKALYRPRHLEETIEAAFYEKSGRPILGITRLVPAGSAENPP